MHVRRFVIVTAAVAAAILATSGCGVVYWTALQVVYEKADLPESQIVRDISYLEQDNGGSPKQRLDLFLPSGRDWPVMVFAHGGGWDKGDRALRVGWQDIYANVGRFNAANGNGTAVLSYRLLPTVAWRAQVDDVADAVAWVHRHIGERGGRASALFVAGHSAGAQLVARVALDRSLLAARGLPGSAICGVIGVSGAGYDLLDPVTYELGADVRYYRDRFGTHSPASRPTEDDRGWQRDASPVTYLAPPAPPFLLMYSSGEHRGFERQARVFDLALRTAGVASAVVAVPGHSHERMVISLSRGDRPLAPAVFDFIARQPCAEK
jgi:acetyl esterase/lipase